MANEENTNNQNPHNPQEPQQTQTQTPEIENQNQNTLTNQIQEQNDSIDAYLKKQEHVSFQLKSMEAEKNEALREFNSLRDKFSKHDMDSLALAKPKLIETRVNNGTRKVKEALVKITDPDQFEPQEEPVETPEIKIETPDAKADIRG